MVATIYTVTVGSDGTIQLPTEAARPGETITLRITRPAASESVNDRALVEHEQTERAETGPDDSTRLTRLTAKTPEQKEQWRRQMDELIDRLAPMLKDMPDHGDFLYGDDGLPR